jgi:hypothetical protein
MCGRGLGRQRRGVPKKFLGKMKDVAGHGRKNLWNRKREQRFSLAANLEWTKDSTDIILYES